MLQAVTLHAVRGEVYDSKSPPRRHQCQQRWPRGWMTVRDISSSRDTNPTGAPGIGGRERNIIPITTYNWHLSVVFLFNFRSSFCLFILDRFKFLLSLLIYFKLPAAAGKCHIYKLFILVNHLFIICFCFIYKLYLCCLTTTARFLLDYFNSYCIIYVIKQSGTMNLQIYLVTIFFHSLEHKHIEIKHIIFINVSCVRLDVWSIACMNYNIESIISNCGLLFCSRVMYYNTTALTRCCEKAISKR